MIQIQQIKLKIPHKETDVTKKFCKILHIPEKRVRTFRILKRSLDARRKPELFYVYTAERWRGRRPLESVSRRTARSRSVPRYLITPIRLPAQGSFPIVR